MATFRNLEIEGATYVKRLEIREPGEGDMVVGPAAGHGYGDFVLVVTVEGPIIRGGELFDHVDRMLQAICFFFSCDQHELTFVDCPGNAATYKRRCDA